MSEMLSILVVCSYLLAILILSLIIKKRGLSAGHDFSTGGQQFGWLAIGTSILVSYISAMTFIGMPGWVYQSGMQVMSMHMNYPIVIFFAATIFVPIFYNLKVKSIYEYLEDRFGIYARTINSVTFIIIQCISSGIMLYATSLIAIRILPVSITEAIIYISMFTALYTCFGGMATVIFTDILQSIVLLTGTVALIITLLFDIDSFSLTSAVSHLTVTNLKMNLSDDTTLVSGILAVSFLHLSVFGTNQLMIQRTLAAKNVDNAQKAMMVCGYGAFFVYLMFAFLGLLLFYFYGGKYFENSNEVILDYVFKHTNPVVFSMILLALTSASMSTLDSTYNSIATVSTFDIYKRFIRPNEDSGHYERVARALSPISALLIVIPAILSISNESVLKSIASMASIFVGIRLGSFLLGIFSEKANEKGIIVGSISSIFAVFYCQSTAISWPWYAPVGTCSFILTGLLVSYFWGSNSDAQLTFFHKQKGLLKKPQKKHYGLLVFFVFTQALSYFIPVIYRAIATQ
ncbi:sodium:solute symporter family transporter [Aeromonas aquatilis]